MAKRIIKNPTVILKDYLIKSKDEFREQLKKRIEIGEDLIKRPIPSSQDFAILQDDYSSWYNYNVELLKQAFDRPNNYYHDEYVAIDVGSLNSAFVSNRPYTPSEQLYELRSDINVSLKRIKHIYDKIDLMETIIKQEVIQTNVNLTQVSLAKLENVFAKFHKVGQSLRLRYKDRPTIIINDEYDVQDLLRSLLKLYYDDIREEDYVPSYAGSNSRIDFVLKNEKIVIETKMTNEKLTDREIGNQLLIDIGRYRTHQDCKTLIAFVYDKGDYIINKVGLKNDLEKLSSTELLVKVYINPE